MDLSFEEKGKVMLDVSSRLKTFTEPYKVAIYGVIDEDQGELLGSGTYLLINNEVYILTARHVILKKKNYKYIAHSIGYGQKPVIICGPFYTSDELQDIALAKINSSVKDYISALDIEKDICSSCDVDKDILFLHGFYQEGSRFSGLSNGVRSNSLPYGSVYGEYSYDWVDPKIHFAFEYPTDYVKNENEQIINLPQPYGLSGSGVWISNRASCGSGWNPSKAQLVGVAINWDQKGKSLITTRIESVLNLIASMKSERRGCLGFLKKMFV